MIPRADRTVETDGTTGADVRITWKVLMSIKKKISGELAEKYERSEKILLHGLTRRQREILLKENPIRSQRNAAIRYLRFEGVSWAILSRVTGLRECQIGRILKN